MPAHQISQAVDLTQLQGCKDCCSSTSLICISCTFTLLCPLCFVFAETQLISQQLPGERPCCLFFSRESFQMCFSHWDDQISASIRNLSHCCQARQIHLDTEKIKFVCFSSVCLTQRHVHMYSFLPVVSHASGPDCHTSRLQHDGRKFPYLYDQICPVTSHIMKESQDPRHPPQSAICG